MTTPGSANVDAGTIPAPFSDVCFEIGDEDKLAELRARFPSQPEDDDGKAKMKDAFNKALADMQIQIGALLKTDTVSFLFGAGASRDCGGVLISQVPLEVERELLQEGVAANDGNSVRPWLRDFYYAVKQVSRNPNEVPATIEDIVQRGTAVAANRAPTIEANYESLLSVLHRWRAAMQKEGGRLRVGDDPVIDLRSDDLEECLRRATRALAQRCRLPVQGKEPEFEAYTTFVRKVLTRPLNLKRVNVFTLNYDTLVEQAADAEGVVLIDGFVGTLQRIFRPECYDQDLYFPAETTEGRVHRHDRVVHLYKLHGSITWVALEPEWDNPYGLVAKTEMASESDQMIVYPTPGKFGETLGMPYAELFRRFASAVVRPQSTLFVMGYGFGDDHVNAIIRQAVVVPSFTVVIVDPDPQSAFARTLRKKKDQRVWIFSGRELGAFSRFVRSALPDLQDEEVQRKVIATHRALKSDAADSQEASPDG